MRNNKILISLIFGLFVLTVCLAWYSAKRTKSEIVFAQSGPFPTGCIAAVDELIECVVALELRPAIGKRVLQAQKEL